MTFTQAELFAYGTIIVVALLLRLGGLGAQPLSDAEASQALVSWRLYQAQAPQPGTYSPLLATLNLVGFAMFGASDFVARLWPALFGVLLVVLPLGLRRQLGVEGAVAASALLATSSTALYVSRTASGDVMALTGGLAVMVGLVNWLEAVAAADGSWSGGRHVVLTAGGLILLFTSAPVAYSVLLLLLIFGLAVVVGARRHRHQLSSARTALAAEVTTRKTAYVGLLLMAVAVATGLFFNMRGVGAAVNLPVEWARGFVVPAELRSAGLQYPAAFLLSLYEPLILFAGLFGLASALVRRSRFDLLLVGWFFGGLVLDLLRSGRSPGESLVSLVPAALLAGSALGQLVVSLRRDAAWPREGLMTGAGLVICTYGYVQLMMYTRVADGAVWLALAAPIMLVILVLVLWQLQDGVAALRGAALTVLVAMAAFSVATAVRLNYSPQFLPVQPMAGNAAGEGISDLVDTLRYASTERVRDPSLVAGLGDRSVGAAVEWQLREFSNLRWVDSADHLVWYLKNSGTEAEAPTVIVTDTADLLSDIAYAGQDFVIRSSGRPQLTSVPSLIRWIVLRDAQPMPLDRAILWVKQPSDAVATVP
jgi:uncharacterized protein (TIGR03663 family)